MKEALKYVLVFFIISVSVFFISYSIYKEENNKIADLYSLNIIEENDNWIYEISRDNQLLIRQEYIPVIEGKIPFKTKRDAEIIGTLVLNKLNKNNNPTITIDEIISNNINFN